MSSEQEEIWCITSYSYCISIYRRLTFSLLSRLCAYSTQLIEAFSVLNITVRRSEKSRCSELERLFPSKAQTSELELRTGLTSDLAGHLLKTRRFQKKNVVHRCCLLVIDQRSNSWNKVTCQCPGDCTRSMFQPMRGGYVRRDTWRRKQQLVALVWTVSCFFIDFNRRDFQKFRKRECEISIHCCYVTIKQQFGDRRRQGNDIIKERRTSVIIKTKNETNSIGYLFAFTLYWDTNSSTSSKCENPLATFVLLRHEF